MYFNKHDLTIYLMYTQYNINNIKQVFHYINSNLNKCTLDLIPCFDEYYNVLCYKLICIETLFWHLFFLLIINLPLLFLFFLRPSWG